MQTQKPEAKEIQLTASKQDVTLDHEAIDKKLNRIQSQIDALEAEKAKINRLRNWEFLSEPYDKYSNEKIQTLWEFGLGMVSLSSQWSELSETQHEILKEDFPQHEYTLDYKYPSKEIKNLIDRGFLIVQGGYYVHNPYAEY